MIRVFRSSRFLLPSVQLSDRFIRQESLNHCFFVLSQVATVATFTIVMKSALWREEERSGITVVAVFVCDRYGKKSQDNMQRKQGSTLSELDWTTFRTAALWNLS